MPDLIRWVIYEGKTYCLDKMAGKVVEVKFTELQLDQVPKELLVAMLNETEEGK
jgi:hypothetical protein